jgi:hypothetical protein
MAIISVTGTNHIGKTTFVNDFLKKWPKYELVKENNIIEVDTTKNSKKWKDFEKQEKLELDISIEQLKGFDSKKNKKIIDGCILDNLIRVLYFKDKNPTKISDDFVWQTVMKVKNNISRYDAIFYIPLTKKYSVAVEDKKIDLIKREEFSNLFEGIVGTYKEHKGSYFPLNECAAVLEIFGSPKERIAIAGLYMDEIDKIN